MAGSRDDMRVSDAERTAAGEVLRVAFDEGRLDFHEYDERLRAAYAAKTYGELSRLTADLPAAPAAERDFQLVPLADAQPATVPPPAFPDATRRWLLATWDDYATAVGICVGIWVVVALLGAGFWYFWPAWVAGPWGVVLAVQTVRGLATGEPQRWAAKQAHKKAIKAERRERKRAALDGSPDAALDGSPEAAIEGAPDATVERRDVDRDQG